MASMDLARKAFASMKEPEGEAPSPAADKPSTDPGPAAGRRLAAALTSGDGAKIYDAFKAMVEECGPTDAADDMHEGEE